MPAGVESQLLPILAKKTWHTEFKSTRGVIEVKPTSEDTGLTAEGEQVLWRILAGPTNEPADCILVGQDAEGRLVKLEFYHLAPSEAEFWKACIHIRCLATAGDLTD